MKQRAFLLSFLIPFFTLLGIQVFAQNSGSLLWEISGKNLKQKSYLFGTIHVQDEKVFDLSGEVLQAFESCDAFAMEVILDEVDPEVTQEAILMEEGSIKDLLSEEDYALLDEYFKEKTGASIALYSKLKPFFIYSQLIQLNMKTDMPMALDMFLLEKAREAGMLTFSVEKFEEQIGAIDQISYKEQCEMLMEEVKKIDDGEAEKEYEELLAAYLTADLDKMIELTTDTALPENFNQAFLIDRNYVMAKRITKMAKKQSTFCAVGAAHLGGPEGVIAILMEKGYTLTPIKSN